jgi:hypothetical protein
MQLHILLRNDAEKKLKVLKKLKKEIEAENSRFIDDQNKIVGTAASKVGVLKSR